MNFPSCTRNLNSASNPKWNSAELVAGNFLMNRRMTVNSGIYNMAFSSTVAFSLVAYLIVYALNNNTFYIDK